MKIKVGLDIGGSTTKIVGMREGKIIARDIVRIIHFRSMTLSR